LPLLSIIKCCSHIHCKIRKLHFAHSWGEGFRVYLWIIALLMSWWGDHIHFSFMMDYDRASTSHESPKGQCKCHGHKYGESRSYAIVYFHTVLHKWIFLPLPLPGILYNGNCFTLLIQWWKLVMDYYKNVWYGIFLYGDTLCHNNPSTTMKWFATWSMYSASDRQLLNLHLNINKLK
jgi:hypothetical protein